MMTTMRDCWITAIRMLWVVLAQGRATGLCTAAAEEQQEQVRHPQQQHRTLVVNGKDAARGRYPYFVALGHNTGAGALIAPDIVLSAGHCLPTKESTTTFPLRIGAYNYNTTNNNNTTQDLLHIVHAVRHPDFERLGDDEFQHDFVLFKLNKPVSTSAIVVKLNRKDRLPLLGQALTVMGLGVTSQDPAKTTRPTVLQEATLKAISNDECSQSKDRKRKETYQHRIVPTHLCTTGGPHNQRDACAYDSGGPIVIPGASAKDDLLVALVSWGELCGDPDFPGVNSRVSEVSDWIDATVCAMSEAPPAEFCAPPPLRLRYACSLIVVAFFVVVMMVRRTKGVSSTSDDDEGSASLLAEKEDLYRSDSLSSSSEYNSIEVVKSTEQLYKGGTAY